MLQHLRNDNGRLQTFIGLSNDFRTGKINATQYYNDLTSKFLGTDAAAQNLFREIVALLPDVHRRRSLIDVWASKQQRLESFPSLSPSLSAPVSSSAPAMQQPTGPTYSSQLTGRGPTYNSSVRLDSEAAFPTLPGGAPRRPAPAPAPAQQQQQAGRGGKKGKGGKVLFTVG